MIPTLPPEDTPTLLPLAHAGEHDDGPLMLCSLTLGLLDRTGLEPLSLDFRGSRWFAANDSFINPAHVPTGSSDQASGVSAVAPVAGEGD